LQNREYGGGFLYGQPELFVGSLGDGLLVARSEALTGVGGGGGGGGVGGGVNSGGGGTGGGADGDPMKPSLRHDGSSFLHPHAAHSPSSASSAPQHNGRTQQVRNPGRS